MATIGFIGLGNMGGPMVGHLVAAGHQVRGFDLSAIACEKAAAAGVTITSTLKGVAAGAQVVMTMLPAGRNVRAVWSDLLPEMAPGALIIDCSTIDVASSRAAHEQAAARGCLSVDAPVSGGVGGARAATLTFMVGGTEAAFAAAEPVLKLMGRKVVHCGPAGNGQAAKICNNMLLGISMIGTAEAFVLAEKLGLSHQALFDVASTSSGQCWSLTSYCPVPGPVPASPANNDYKPGFATGLMLKDLKLAEAAALGSNATTPLGTAAAQLYALYAATGGMDEDFSGIIRFLRGKED